MADKMLIDASHEEETRVVVVRGNRIEEFDFESQHKKQLRGNIYLAKVTRVEPSLQAAFVDYGGNRHGFLAFSEIHPDYYQIPVADRQALIEAEAAEARAEDDDGEEEKSAKKKTKTRRSRSRSSKDTKSGKETKAGRSGKKATGKAKKSDDAPTATPDAETTDQTDATDLTGAAVAPVAAAEAADTAPEDTAPVDSVSDPVENGEPDTNEDSSKRESDDTDTPPDTIAAAIDQDEISEAVGKTRSDAPSDDEEDDEDESDPVESVGADDALEEVLERSRKPRKQYRIQEVIKRRQILLVQVVKEERGNKGAALTTYLSLAGRYSVLMPNTARGGGISRKITNVQDRKRLKEIARGLDVPQGMGVILRTAGANRTKAEIKRDFEYLMRLWDNVRNLTLKSTAPCLVYEEGSLIKRSIRDLYNKDIGEIIVSGDTGYREAKDFMKMLMPSHAKVVQPYREVLPIFARSGIEAQLDRMLQPQVTLRSGGYIIINQTEALVAIDVNSGRSTKEHSIEDTALRTNMEAAEEVARQLRLRDLAGLIVIDFIDMEEKRNNRSVEKKLKECLKSDRARIQVGRISHFGLLEMSRQRIRASVLESTMQICEHCEGTGHVRSDSSVALYVLRSAEEFLLRNTRNHITIRTLPNIALYLLNQKRDSIIDLETRFGLSITVEADADIGQQHIAIDRGEPVDSPVEIEAIPEVVDVEEVSHDADARDGDEDGRRRKRRRKRRGRDEDTDEEQQETQASGGDGTSRDSVGEDDGEPRRKRRRRGKRGGRRNRDAEAGMKDAGTESDTTTEAVAESEDGNIETSTELSEAPTAEAPAAGGEGQRTEETPPVESGAEDATSQVEAAEAEEPKPRTRRRTRKASAPQATETNEGDVTESPTAASVVDGEVVSPKVEAIEITVHDPEPARAEDNPENVAEVTQEKPKRSRRRSAAEDEIAEPKVTSSVAETSEETEEPKKTKRVGWWQRRGFF